MDGLLRQSTLVTVSIGPFTDKTDGVSEETASTLSVLLSKNGAAFAARSSSTVTTHDTHGMHFCPLNATDTNTLGILKLGVFDSATFVPVWHNYMVVPANVYDSLVVATAVLSVDAVRHGGSTQTGRDIGASVIVASGTITSITNNVPVNGGTITVVTGAVGSITTPVVVASGTITTVTGNVGGSVASVTAAVTLTSAYDAAKTAAPAATALSSATWTNTKAGYLDQAISAPSVVASGTITSVTNPVIVASGTITSVTNNVTVSGGTITTVTGAVGSVTAAVTLTSAYDAAKNAMQAGSTVVAASGTITTVTGNVGGSVASVTAPVTVTSGTITTVTGSVGSVAGAVGSVTGAVTVGTFSTNAKGEINAEVVDVIRTDAITELSGVPASNAPLSQQVAFSYQALRNARTQGTTQTTIANDAGATIATATVSDTASLFTKGKYA